MQVISPLTNNNNVELERMIDPAFLKEEYMDSYNIDVNSYFEKTQSINIYKCLETGFRFYFPRGIDGDSKFYEKLQKFPWYYMDWKWEHQVIKNRIKQEDFVLEIGSAKGSFLKRLKEKGIKNLGLELNNDAVDYSKKEGLNVFAETIQEHAVHNMGKYDIVCSFQVMEHITDVRAVIDASIKVLKKGGKLIISVPNNSSFIKKSPNSILNMPPHHMCLWDEVSLASLEDVFPIKKEELLIEPLQDYHYPVVWSNMIYKLFPIKLIAKVMNKITYGLGLYRLVGLRRNKIVGHSIIGIYTKK